MFSITASSIKVTAKVNTTAAKKSSPFANKAAVAGAAAAILLAGPAHADRLGLTLQNGTGLAPGKYEQPFYDPRPVVLVEKDACADITVEGARIAPNVQRGPAGCKTITGAPCVDFSSGK
uniref:Uncharacterized protein n=2 Tax=Ostreococcus mediterraneus TaxID=1486918 RepID=A0A6U0FMQ6_9CHLO|mmetsp:Transcript_931/g.3434  ORF Transcript_931/g.3434 Transcript_931/m.3434 type:complete len:120 (+) Transcript_931:48-407(+)